MCFIKHKFDKPLDWWLACCYIVTAIVLIIALVCCTWVFCHTVVSYDGNFGVSSGRSACGDSIYYGSVSLEKYDNLPEDSLLTIADMRHILDTQKTIILQQDKLADDLRQETNNIINKMNGWLGFWIGLIAVIGALVPIALNYKQHHDFKESEGEMDKRIRHALSHMHKELREERSKCNEELKKCNGAVDSANEKVEKSISDMLAREKERIERSKNDIEERWKGIVFTKAVRDFQLVCECPSFQNSECRNELLQQIWRRILEGMHELIRDYSKDKGGEFHKQAIERLASGLVLVSTVLEMVRIMQPRRLRKLGSVNSLSITLACKLTDPTELTNNLKDQLSDYYSSLSSLDIL